MGNIDKLQNIRCGYVVSFIMGNGIVKLCCKIYFIGGNIMVNPKYHIFVCTSCRINGKQQGFCASNEAVDVVQRFMEEIDSRDLSGEVMLTNTGCFGICSQGPIVVIYPEGVWYGAVSTDDVEEIMESHIEGGEIVKRLKI